MNAFKAARQENESTPLHFGVGCIFFAPISKEKTLSDQYYEEINNNLSKIENISGIKIQNIDSKYGSYLEYKDDLDLRILHIYHARIKFDIFIPKKKQDDLGFWCGSENLVFDLRNEYYFPVCYISSKNYDELFIPTIAIALVREYLTEKLKNLPLAVCTVGPSPFHADFFANQSTDSKGNLIDISEGAGYKSYIFEADNLESGIDEFAEKYGDVISLFYQLQNLRGHCIGLQVQIVNDTSSLINEIKDAEKFKRIKILFSSSKEIDQINISSLEDTMIRSEMQSLLDENSNESSMQHIFNDLEFHFRHLQRFSKDSSHFAALDAVRSIEIKRQNLFQNVSVLIAGLCGGILGALLGATITVVLSN